MVGHWMGEAFFLNRPFKPLVKHPFRGELLRAASHSILILIDRRTPPASGHKAAGFARAY
jgi:hypothetical protein